MVKLNHNQHLRIKHYAEILSELICKGKLNAYDPIIEELKTKLIDNIVSVNNISRSELGALIDKEFENLQ